MDVKSLRILAILMSVSFMALAQNPSETKLDSSVANGLDSIVTESLDSLRSKRGVFSTAIYQGEAKLRPSTIVSLFREDTTARRRYKWGQRLLPIGPALSVAGIALGYVALKGVPASVEINYEGQPITAHYTIRSRPKLLGGLVLFIGGIALIELSNELIARSVIRFNSTLHNPRAASQRPSFHFGITPSGNVGLYGRF